MQRLNSTRPTSGTLLVFGSFSAAAAAFPSMDPPAVRRQSRKRSDSDEADENNQEIDDGNDVIDDRAVMPIDTAQPVLPLDEDAIVVCVSVVVSVCVCLLEKIALKRECMCVFIEKTVCVCVCVSQSHTKFIHFRVHSTQLLNTH